MAAVLGSLGGLETLNLAANALSGPVPAELGSLGELETLSLAANSLSGPVPAELGALSGLVTLNLAANDLSGPVPAELGSLGSLLWMSLGGNDLSGPVPAELGSLGAVGTLNLAGNDLSGLIPAVLGEMASLRLLFLDGNGFAWPPPVSLSTPRAGLLVRLPHSHEWAPAAPGAVEAVPRVDGLELSWAAPAAGEPAARRYELSYRRAGGAAAVLELAGRSVRLGGLVAGVSYEVSVAGVNFNGRGAAAVVAATPLESPCGEAAVVDQTRTLLVADCEALWSQRRALTDASALSGAAAGEGVWGDSTAVHAWRGVTVTEGRVSGVDLSGVGLVGQLASGLGDLSALVSLDLSANTLSGPVPAGLGNLAGLTALDLSDNALTGPVPARLGSLAQLTELDLGINDLSGAVPAALGSLGRLRVLDLAGNDLSGLIPAQLGSLSALEVLRLSGAGLSATIPAGLGSLTSLTELHIDGAGLTGPIPAALGSLTNLSTLHLGGGFSGPIPAALASLTGLESLYVSSPNISGPLPAQLATLTNLETLWIKSDNLTGAIPAGYADLTSLDTLYLSGGGLTGTVPAWTGSLTSLQRLYLHNNDLTGPIPPALASHNSLTTLWLAGNDLRGPIPNRLGDTAALETLDLRDNPLTWPAPASLAEPRTGLTVLLPDTPQWLPPPPAGVAAEPSDGALTVTWQHPGAGEGYLVDHYTVNHRRAGTTAEFTRTAASGSPAVINDLDNGADYHIFVTATNDTGTSGPSEIIEAAPTAATGGAEGSAGEDPQPRTVNPAAMGILISEDILDGTRCASTASSCRLGSIKRWEFAMWLARVHNGPSDTEPADTWNFDDVSTGDSYYHHVAYLAQNGITTGCGGGSFCPDRPVSRSQLATFVDRAFPVPATNKALAFTDVSPTSVHAPAINRLHRAGITTGCVTHTRYCPTANALRQHAATFIVAARCYRSDYAECPGNGGGNNQRPPAPTGAEAEPAGPGALRVTWTPGQGDPTATSWKITYNRYRLLAHQQGGTRRVDDPTQSETLRAADVDPNTGVTIDELQSDTHYAITIRGIAAGTTGHPSPEATAKTDPAAVRLVALEITQGLQNWQGDITLVKGKRTVVRAFLEPGNGVGENVRVVLDLLGTDGRTIDTKTPVNANTKPTVRPFRNFRAQAGAANNRANLNASANFILDDELWIGEPGNGDTTRTYKLVVTPNVDCQDAVNPANTCTATITLTDIKVPRVVIVPLRIAGRNALGEVKYFAPTKRMIIEHVRRIKSLMPVPEVEIFVHSQMEPIFPDAMPPDKSEQEVTSSAIFDALEEVQGRHSDQTVVLGLGFEPPRGWIRGAHNGVGYVGGALAWWKTRPDTSSIGSDVYGRHTGSHEFGHVLGAGHAVYKVPPHEFRVACSKTVQAGAREEFPYLAPAPTEGAARAALLGPTGGPNLAVWGLDTRVFDNDMALPATLAVMDPSVTYSIMSYCGSSTSDSRQDRWVDEYYHEVFVKALKTRYWGRILAGTSPVGDGATAAVRDVLVISGSRTVAADGSVDVVLSPAYTYGTDLAVTARSGDWVLELLDSTGSVLRSVPFGADVPMADIDPAQDPPRLSTERWRVAVADPPTYASYRIRRGSETVAASEVSASAPSVSVTAPTAGQTFSASTVEVSWTGSDADGDDMVYHVHYSDDGGATYSTVGAGLTSTSLVIDRDQLAGSTRARFLVIASDGTRSTTAQSPVFTVAENRPAVIVHSPAEGRVYGGESIVVLDATGIDTEDGVLADSALVWTSSLDGQIAAGGYARIATGTLTEGTHVLAVTATDSSAMTASVSVTVTVNATNGAPAARPDTAYGRVGRAISADVLGNDTDPEADIDPWSVRVVAPAALGAATANGPSPGAIAYEPKAQGIDVIVYEACDRLLQCSTTELVVAVLEDR